MPLAEPLGEFRFELFVKRQRAVRRARASCAGAVFSQGFARGRYHFGVERQPKIVVRPEHQRWSTVDDYFTRTDDAIDHGQTGYGRARRVLCEPVIDGT